MAYKDEYEVARLHRNFKQVLTEQYEEGFTVNYHMAPPLVSRKLDARGRPIKKQFGQRMDTSFGVLQKMKFLRGTPADIFGYSGERRMERRLIVWFQELLNQCGANTNPANRDTWLEILQSPMDIRGYGPVKEEAVSKVRLRVENLLQTIED